jgi:DNA-binding MurR/RpiR family transcriptional regulator
MSSDSNKKIPRPCILKIKSVYDNLKSAERRAVDFLLKFPVKAANLSVTRYAEQAGCSEATVVRMARRLGYEGFPELKKELARHANQDSEQLKHASKDFKYEGISSRDSTMTVVGKVFETTIVAIRDTFKVLDKIQYERAVNTLLKAKSIMFCGVGDAALVAMEAYQRFVRIGEHCLVSVDPDVQLIMSSQLTKGDVVVAISHSGRSKTVLNAVKLAKRSGVTVVAVTNFPISPLTKHSDIVLLTAVFSEHVTGEVISKRITELCLIESLYINCLIRRGKPVLTRLAKSNRAVSQNKL